MEEDSTNTLLSFFLSKSPGSDAISRQKHLELPVVRTDDRAYGYVVTQITRMNELPNFLRYGASRARETPLQDGSSF